MIALHRERSSIIFYSKLLVEIVLVGPWIYRRRSKKWHYRTYFYLEIWKTPQGTFLSVVKWKTLFWGSNKIFFWWNKVSIGQLVQLCCWLCLKLKIIKNCMYFHSPLNNFSSFRPTYLLIHFVIFLFSFFNRWVVRVAVKVV